MFIIYRIINSINGKAYIGFTTKTKEVRWYGHQKASALGSKFHIHCAMRKYGTESFILETLEEGLDPEIGKNIREPYWISLLMPEYNKTTGGDGVIGYKHTQATRKLMSNSHKGKPHSLQTRTKMSISSKNRSDEVKQRVSKTLSGRILSDEHKLKIGLAHLGKKSSPETKLKLSLIQLGKKRGLYKPRNTNNGK